MTDDPDDEDYWLDDAWQADADPLDTRCSVEAVEVDERTRNKDVRRQRRKAWDRNGWGFR